MSPLWTVALSTIIAILASLLTIFLTHYHFWRFQRRGELRLAAIDEVNRLAAEFITAYIEAENQGDKNFKPNIEFFQSLQVATAKIKALFSGPTYGAFKRMEVMMVPNLGPTFRQRTVDDFIQARDAALQSLYKEVGVLPQKPHFLTRFRLRPRRV
jgi:hypothetical protein